jgi:glycosyltransferase involved in cell wall biosynthesis
MRTPTVSVCVPTYNGAAFLSHTLESISAQTFDDFEVLIVDDTSTDATIDIADAYAARDPRARVIRNTERAGSSARNANQCLRHARGEWIKFLFQDDLMAPTCLARMVEAGRRGPLVVSWHDYLFASDVDDTVRGYYERLPTLAAIFPGAAGTVAGVDEFCDAVLTHWNANVIGPTSSSFIHRDCFARYGAFSSEIRTFPDLEYWVRVGNNVGLSIVPEPLVTFRVHNASISSGIRDATRQRDILPLEPLLFLLLLAHAPEYENIRRRALHRQPPIDPDQLLRDAALGARWFAGEVRYRKRDDALLRQWSAFCESHPVMHDILRQVDARMSRWAKLKQYVKARL